MMTNKGDATPREICPYDPSHVILHHRMQVHLVKCRRNHADALKATCCFNSTHQVPEPELSYHHENCEDRRNLDQFTYSTEPANPERYLLPQAEIAPTEDWDNEPERPSYDPEQYCQKNQILRNTVIQTQSQAVRRNFRMEERQRMQELINQNSSRNTSNDIPQRRPVGGSEGIENRGIELNEREIANDGDLLDVENLLERVNLGSHTLTTPKLIAPKIENNNVVNPSETWTNRQISDGGNSKIKSTGAIPRTSAVSQSSGINRAGPNLQNTAWGPNRNSHTRAASSADPFAESNFPQLQPARNARPVGRGRGSSFSRK